MAEKRRKPKMVGKVTAPPAPAQPAMQAADIIGYQSALAYLHERVNLERVPQDLAARHEYKLDRMHALCQALGNPQRGLKCVHVAGTKGKGSTCELISTMAQGCGLFVGLFTSPHISDIRERIRLGGKLISETAFTDVCRQVALVAESLEAALQPDSQAAASASPVASLGHYNGNTPAPQHSSAPSLPQSDRATFFELMTAMCFVHFAAEAVDLAVIEVGLGGLLDCTNVITPEVSVLTLIGRDHMQILGDTVELIAAQKAGIIKPGIPAITFVQDPRALGVFRATAKRLGAPLLIAGESPTYTILSEPTRSGQQQWMVSIKTEHFDLQALPVPIPGEHQAHNLALALVTLDTLARRGMAITEAGAVAGLETTRLPGRFEVLRTTPRIVLDVAHNPESIDALMKTLRQNLQFDSLVMVFGCASDKDWPAMLAHLSTSCDKVFFTKSTGSPRAQDPKEMYRIYTRTYHKMAQISKSLPDAIRMAKAAAAAGDAICITGSFYLVGEAKKILASQ